MNVRTAEELKDGFILPFGHSFNTLGKEIDSDFFIRNHLINGFTQLTPMFFYFVYNIDKNIRKFTRGKAGKYVFV